MLMLVMVTIPEKDAEGLAKMLLSEKICACVNIVKGVKSLFWWEGKVDVAEEVILIIKTKELLFGKLKALVKNNHPYKVPEIIGFKVDSVNQEYLDWVNKEANAVSFSS